MAKELLRDRRKRLADEELRAIADIIRDPVRFSRHILRHDPWSMAEQVMTAVATKRRVAVKACHSSGKTFLAAAVALWWTMRYADGKVITTAPTFTQVERLLWGEMRSAAAQSKIALPQMHKTQLDLANNNFALGLSTNEGIRFQGWHGGHILIILDEAPGVLAEIYEAIEGIEAGGEVHLLLLGNPVIASGHFYDAFGVNAALWERFTISAFDTPNLAGLDEASLLALPDEELDNNVRPYLTTRRWVRDRLVSWGHDHPKYASRVLAEFPSQSEYSLVSLAWIERAEEPRALSAATPIEAGIDVAGPGKSETVVTIRAGDNVILTYATTVADPRGDVVRCLNPFKSLPGFLVKVDSIGIGYNFGLHLQDKDFAVEFVNVGAPSSDPEKYANLKAELYWGLRNRFDDGSLGGLTDVVTQAQLSTIEWRPNPRGQVYIVPKDEMAKRGIASPDRAESLMLAFARVSRVLDLYDPSKYKVLAAVA